MIFLTIFLFVPDPRKWSREEDREWLMWMSLRHKVPIDPARFQMNGKALCLMSLQMFAFRVPIGGKLLYKDFQLRLTSAFHRELYETKSQHSLHFTLVLHIKQITFKNSSTSASNGEKQYFFIKVIFCPINIRSKSCNRKRGMFFVIDIF